jgi:hypothetical protein
MINIEFCDLLRGMMRQILGEGLSVGLPPRFLGPLRLPVRGAEEIVGRTHGRFS